MGGDMPYKVKRICCIGAGYVGGPTMSVIAKNCPEIEVTVVDLDKSRIDDWNDNDLSKLPIFEPGLDQVIQECRNRNLFFTTDIDSAISNADIVFLSVNTPTKVRGIGAGRASDLKWIEASARQVASFAKGHTIVVEKSTIPVRTAETIKIILNSSYKIKNSKNELKTFSVLSNPEFLSEGSAISDLEDPDRVLIGGDDPEAINCLSGIYEKWINSEKILKTNLWSSELSKLAANAFLAQRISSINTFSSLCEKTGADISEVSKAIGMDKRIGSKFLNAGPGFGGSCFKKDILNLIYIANFYKLPQVADYWEKVLEINLWQQNRIVEKIVENLFGTLSYKKLAVFGFSFKSNTNDTRESPAIKICQDLIKEGANLLIYDPKVSKKKICKELQIDPGTNKNVEGGTWNLSKSIYDAVKDSLGIVVLTEWEEFRYIDWEKIAKLTEYPIWLFDTRNICNKEEAIRNNINVWNIGSNY